MEINKRKLEAEMKEQLRLAAEKQHQFSEASIHVAAATAINAVIKSIDGGD